MSTEEGEAGPGCVEASGGTVVPHRHTWEEEGEPHGSQGRPHPDDEDEAEEGEEEAEGENCREARSCGDACGGDVENNGGNFSSEDGAVGGTSCKTQPMHSSCSSETCIPTPSCRICFQGAEQWQSITITLVEKVQIIAVFLGSLFLVASISWLLWSAISPQAVWQRRDVLFQICYGMYGFMDLVCVGLIVHEGAAVYNVFMRWRAVNLHWDVQSYDKAKDMEETSTGHSSLAPRTLWLPLATFGPNGPLHPTQLGQHPWTCLCFSHFCPGLVTQNDLGQDSDSGEVVIRVTSV
ncbi:E3 ubiquitin-protein ligase MARCHF11 isoform X2 [Channa argus]|uniref:E3 ubiquitin-protein ligase MARCHF11 isoform X2 n=1 Tax=Channa argus TaxID=215402 RepID=UPI003521F173